MLTNIARANDNENSSAYPGVGLWRRLITVLSLALMTVTLYPNEVSAQGFDEIVVTSRKIEESLQDVPVSVTAFDARTIEEARIENLDDLASLTPGLSFFNPAGDALSVPVIRGVAPTDIFGEPNAAIYVDGVYAAGREGLNFSLLDIQRIEVNKGPQSALYGRNAFSGAINYITKRPADTFESYVEATGGNESRYAGKVSVTGPLIEEALAFRVSASYDTWDGSYDNPVSSENVGGYEYKTLTSSLEWTPTDNFSALFNGYYSDDEIDEPALTSQPANCENTGPNDDENRRLSNVCGEVWDLNTTNKVQNAGILGNPNIPADLQFKAGSTDVARIAGASGEEREVTRLSLNLSWFLGFGSIDALSGYSRVEQESVQDAARGLGYTLPFVYCDDVIGYIDAPENTVPVCLDAGTPLRFSTGHEIVTPRDTTEEFSQELRFTSDQERAFRYSFGGYVFFFKSDDTTGAILGVPPALPDGLGDPTGPGEPPPGAAFGPFVETGTLGLAIGDPAFRDFFTPIDSRGAFAVAKSTNDSYAAFGSADWDLTDKLTADFQLRWALEKKEIEASRPGLSSKVDEDYDFFTGRAGLSYKTASDWLIYASVSKGSKAGGFDTQPVDIIDPDTGIEAPELLTVSFDNEELWAYEVGAKGDALDGRLRYDMALFRLDWDDIVIPQTFEEDPSTGRPFDQPEGFSTNAGDATVWGWEMQGGVLFTANIEGGFGVSYTDATIDNGELESFVDFPSFAPDGDVSGNQVLRQPEWQANANLRYSRELTSKWSLDTRADVIYQDKYYGGLDNQWTIPEHTYVNLRAALESDRWTISAWVKNLFEDDSPVASFRDVYFNNTDDVLQQDAPSSSPQNFFPWRINNTHPKLRTFGLTVRLRFGDGA